MTGRSRMISIWAFLTMLLMAVSFGPSFAHVLEAWPRIAVWSPELWRETTVFNRQFQFFAVVGAPLDVGSIVFGFVLAFLLRRDRPAFIFALAAAVFYAASLATWFAVVAAANAVLATWQPGPIPEGFNAVRTRWETGHMAVTAFKFFGLMTMIRAVIVMGRRCGS